MKKILAICILFTLISGGRLLAQLDTLTTLTNEKIIGKIIQIDTLEIRYKKASYLDGPTFVVEKSTLFSIGYSTGVKNTLRPKSILPDTVPKENKTTFDTLVTRTKKKIACKVLEIGLTEIRYKRAGLETGPTFVIERSEVLYILFSSGTKDVINEEGIIYESPKPEMIIKRNVLKVEPFSPVKGKIVFGYERVLKKGFNIEAKFGYVNSNF